MKSSSVHQSWGKSILARWCWFGTWVPTLTYLSRYHLLHTITQQSLSEGTCTTFYAHAFKHRVIFMSDLGTWSMFLTLTQDVTPFCLAGLCITPLLISSSTVATPVIRSTHKQVRRNWMIGKPSEDDSTIYFPCAKSDKRPSDARFEGGRLGWWCLCCWEEGCALWPVVGGSSGEKATAGNQPV